MNVTTLVLWITITAFAGAVFTGVYLFISWYIDQALDALGIPEDPETGRRWTFKIERR